jgi:hypothetical protein
MTLLLVVSILSGINLEFTSHVANAQTTNPKYTLLEPLPSIGSTSQSTMQPDITLNDYIKYAINLLIAVSAAAAVFMIVWGGLQYMTTDSWGNKSAGLEKVKNAVIGLLMVLSTYIILRTVNPALVAIPATLVPPITRLATTSASGFLTQLSDDAKATSDKATEYAKNAQAATDAINAAKVHQAALNDQLSKLPADDPGRLGINQQLQNDADTIKQQTIASVVNNTQSGLLTSLVSLQRQAIAGQANAQAMVTYQASVDQYYYDGITGLQKAGIDTSKAENIQQLNDTKAYALGEIYMYTNYGGTNQSEATRISKDSTDQYNLISDSNPLKAKLKTDLDKRLSMLQ